jgi:hypothetical protein
MRRRMPLLRIMNQARKRRTITTAVLRNDKCNNLRQRPFPQEVQYVRQTGTHAPIIDQLATQPGMTWTRCIAMYCIVLPSTAQHNTSLRCTVLRSILLHGTALHRITIMYWHGTARHSRARHSIAWHSILNTV